MEKATMMYEHQIHLRSLKLNVEMIWNTSVCARNHKYLYLPCIVQGSGSC